MGFLRNVCALQVALALLAAPAAAAEWVVTKDFPAEGSLYGTEKSGSGWLTEGGETPPFVSKDDFISASINEPAFDNVTRMVFTFQFNNQLDGYSPGFGVYLNGETIGTWSITPCGMCGIQEYTLDYDFDPVGPLGGTPGLYLFGFGMLRDVPDGKGYMTFLDGGSVTIYGNTVAVPEPGTWALLIVGFAMVGLTLRARRQRPPSRMGRTSAS